MHYYLKALGYFTIPNHLELLYHHG
jgi:hypothetical protein